MLLEIVDKLLVVQFGRQVIGESVDQLVLICRQRVTFIMSTVLVELVLGKIDGVGFCHVGVPVKAFRLVSSVREEVEMVAGLLGKSSS